MWVSGTYGPAPTGMYLGPDNGGRGTLLMAGNQIGTWINVRAVQPIDQLVWEVTTGGDGASTLTCGIYRVSGTTATRIVKSGAVDATAIAVKTASVTATLAPGLHLAVLDLAGQTSTRPTVRATFTGAGTIPLMDLTDLMTDPRGGVHANALTGAPSLPASFTVVTGVSRSYGPVIGMRCA